MEVGRGREGVRRHRGRGREGVGPTCPTSNKPLKYALPQGKACK